MSEVRVEQLPGERVRVTVGSRRFVLAAACPHRKGRLAHGHISAGTLRIVCPLHKSAYDLTTGCRLAGPDAPDLTVEELA